MDLVPAAVSERLGLVGYALLGGLLATGLLALLVKTETISDRRAAVAPASASAKASDAAAACALHATSESCDRCMNTSCVAPCEACASSATCLRLYLCLLDCKDAQCQRECAGQHPEGRKLLETFAGELGCMAKRCRDACR